MTKLERTERAILIFLMAALLLGVAISSLRKMRHPVKVRMEKFYPAKYAASAEAAAVPGEKININSAGVDELASIKGVGRKIAGRIAEYRYTNGSFVSIDDIKNVKGISSGLFEKIRGRITVE